MSTQIEQSKQKRKKLTAMVIEDLDRFGGEETTSEQEIEEGGEEQDPTLFQEAWHVIRLESPLLSVVIAIALLCGHFENWSLLKRWAKEFVLLVWQSYPFPDLIRILPILVVSIGVSFQAPL